MKRNTTSQKRNLIQWQKDGRLNATMELCLNQHSWLQRVRFEWIDLIDMFVWLIALDWIELKWIGSLVVWFCWLIDWLIDVIDLLIDWLLACLIGWSVIVWLVDWWAWVLIGGLDWIGLFEFDLIWLMWLLDWLIDWFISLLVNDWLIRYVINICNLISLFLSLCRWGQFFAQPQTRRCERRGKRLRNEKLCKTRRFRKKKTL